MAVIMLKSPSMYEKLKFYEWNSYGGVVVKNPSAKAGDTDSSPIWEDPTCRGATKPSVPQLLSLCSRAREPQLLSPCATTTEARARRARALQQE